LKPLEQVSDYFAEADVQEVPTEDLENEARPQNFLSVHLGEHWAVVAKTGGGKTWFVVRGLLDYLHRMYPHVPIYIIDSTDDPDMEKLIPNHILIEGNKAPDLLYSSQRPLIWKPRNSKVPKEYAKFFLKMNDERRPQILVVDEVASITGEAENELEPLLKQMRKHNGTVIIESQQVAKVEPTVFRQMTHFVQGRINAEVYDMARARAYLGMTKEEHHPPRSEFGFFYRRTSGGDFPAREFRDYREFFGGLQ
jgi:hypothetical protein